MKVAAEAISSAERPTVAAETCTTYVRVDDASAEAYPAARPFPMARATRYIVAGPGITNGVSVAPVKSASAVTVGSTSNKEVPTRVAHALRASPRSTYSS